MFRLFSCWIYAVLLRGPVAFTSNSSAQHRPPNVTEEETGLDSAFLQLRDSLPSYSQPIRPYTLLTSPEDYTYLPKPRHRRPSRILLRTLGSHFDPFWMSIEQPPEASRVWTLEGDHKDDRPLLRGDSLPDKLPDRTAAKFNFSASPVLREAAADQRRKLEVEAAGLDLGFLPPDVSGLVRAWLVGSATCGLRYRWADLGPAFWPRWLRQTDCERSEGTRSCPFASGMECTRAQTTNLKILAWHCSETRDGGDGGDGSDGGTGTRKSEAKRTCSWRQVPYPVVTACTCSCK